MLGFDLKTMTDLQPLKKLIHKWKYDATVTISLIALIVSCTQLLVTVPLFAKLFFSPKLSMRYSGTRLDSNTLVGLSIVSNEGNVQATKIEIGIQLEPHQRISVVPDITSKITEEKDPILLKSVKIEVERLLPGEKFQIMVFPGPNLEKIHPDMAKMLLKSGIKELPVIQFFKSAEGFGSYAKDEGPREGSPGPDSRK